MYVVVGGTVQAGGTVTLFARLAGANGTPVTQSTLSSIGYVVTDLVAGTAAASVSLTVSAVVFNALQQNDPRWTLDSQYAPGIDGNWGYNFAANLPASTFPLATASAVPEGYPPVQARDYQIDVLFTATDGTTVKQTWRVSVAPTFG